MSFESAPNAPHTPAEKKLNPWLKIGIEIGPLLIFFLANAVGKKIAAISPIIVTLGGPIFFATATFIVATLVALAVSYGLTRRLPLMPFVSAIIVVVFGGLTLWLKDDTFIKIKTTIIYCLFGGVLFGGLAFGKSLMGYVFDAAFKLDDAGWRKLTVRWGLFFFGLALLNEILWRNVSTDTWVTFKAFGLIPLTFVFALLQVRLIERHSLEDKTAE